ncbi:MAG: Biopolymer transport protein [Verrucomicrobiota bacterium]|jgi:biopolymer transport protein ExbD
MPVRLGSKLPREPEARIEIIPLIDIMFFLLAAFMLASLKIIQMSSHKVELPPASAAVTETPRDLLVLAVDADGAFFHGETPIAPNELLTRLSQARLANPRLRVLVRADAEARHRQVSALLDLVRRAGIDQASLATEPATP